ncbi:hypothetical protein [Helicobacter suis]|uniref:hypothetical protein n=1 Tax=Helicobacter suis TaxID=104628 RepID=UPI002490952A|nr:hypothetical protein [Helicobacter suis]
MNLLKFLINLFKKTPPKRVFYRGKNSIYSATHYALTEDGLIVCRETKKVIGALESIIY